MHRKHRQDRAEQASTRCILLATLVESDVRVVAKVKEITL